ncbi:MAG: TetR/AcrR family transcriptional regulator [Desulfobacteraceae bacterium]|nr:TetR/AcrR family transcriptional regulator [Desulfobacteraceae bacterium]
MKKMDTLSKLKEKERKARQNLIVKAARKVFGQKTYDKVSMAEIAKAAGIAKSSIYTYFNSQEELYIQIVFKDSQKFIKEFKNKIEQENKNIVKVAVNYFLDYYILHEAQWRMITHFALHGNKDKESVEKLNHIGRELLDLFDLVFKKLGKKEDVRLLSHALFAALSGILIAFRNYPGRAEEERIAHMKRVGSVLEAMIISLVEKDAAN